MLRKIMFQKVVLALQSGRYQLQDCRDGGTSVQSAAGMFSRAYAEACVSQYSVALSAGSMSFAIRGGLRARERDAAPRRPARAGTAQFRRINYFPRIILFPRIK